MAYWIMGPPPADITVLTKSTDGTSSKSFTISVTDDVSDNNTDIGRYRTQIVLPIRFRRTHRWNFSWGRRLCH